MGGGGALIACGGDAAAPAADHFSEGVFSLQSIGGHSLPYVISAPNGSFQLTTLSDTLAFAGGRAFEVFVVLKQTAGLPDSVLAGSRGEGASYRVSRDSIFLAFTSTDSDTAVYRAGRISIITRIPPATCSKPCELIFAKVK